MKIERCEQNRPKYKFSDDFQFSNSPRPGVASINKEGVITHAHNRHWYALNERFRHAPVGACFKRCRLFEITSFVVTAAEAADLCI
jgi:hypothetical protein